MAKTIGERASVVLGNSALGGGSLPGDELETRLVSVDPAGVAGGAEELTRRLRVGDLPIVARIEDGRVLLDPRTIPPGRDAEVAEAVRAALG